MPAPRPGRCWRRRPGRWLQAALAAATAPVCWVLAGCQPCGRQRSVGTWRAIRTQQDGSALAALHAMQCSCCASGAHVMRVALRRARPRGRAERACPPAWALRRAVQAAAATHMPLPRSGGEPLGGPKASARLTVLLLPTLGSTRLSELGLAVKPMLLRLRVPAAGTGSQQGRSDEPWRGGGRWPAPQGSAVWRCAHSAGQHSAAARPLPSSCPAHPPILLVTVATKRKPARPPTQGAPPPGAPPLPAAAAAAAR